MTAPPDDTTDPQTIIAKLRAERDAAIVREARRDTDYAERAAHQGATVQVLQAMAVSLGGPKPVFEMIVRRARDLCDAYSATLAQVVDGSIALRAYVAGNEAEDKEHEAAFPRPVAADSMFGRAIVARQPVQLPDVAADQTYALREGTLRGAVRAQAAVPLMRNEEAIGAINITRRQTGGFSQAQIELLQVFANQAVIAITSAETYRALQERTAALAQRNSEYSERIEHQSAIIDVLKVMSASPGDPQPVFDLIVHRAQELSNATSAGLFEYDGKLQWRRANSGGDAATNQRLAALFPMEPTPHVLSGRAILDRQIVHVRDMDAEPGLFQAARDAGNKSLLALPLLRDGEAIGALACNSVKPGGFSDSQVALLQTFAEQAVIAITSAETYRALQRRTSDLREALEQQTATAEVLKVINSSPDDPMPVFNELLDRALRLCDGWQGTLWMFDGERMRATATAGYSGELAGQLSEWREIHPFQRRLAQGEPVFQINDLAAEELYRSGNLLTRTAVDVAGIRTVAFVALVKDAATLGGFTIGRREVRAFTTKQVVLLQNFAAQAVIAIENARLINETREALEQQTATAEVLQVINASPGNLMPVFDAMLEKAMRLCGVAFGILNTWDGKYAHVVATRGCPPALSERLVARGPTSTISPAIARLLKTKCPVHVRDVMTGDGYRNGHPDPRALVELGGARTFLAVPLRKDGVILGYIAVYRQEVREFSDKEIALLENFAAQAVIAMENARLINEQREALEQQTATAEVLQVINASPGDLAPVFDAMLEKATRLSGAAYGVLRSFDGEHLHMLASRGVPTEYTEFLAQSGDPGTPGDSLIPGTSPMQAFETRQPVQRLDVRESTGYTSGIPGARAIAELGGARTVLHVPLVKDQTAVGLLTFYRREVRAFSDKQIALLQNFAAQAVIAIENARLLTETREALEQQTATAEVLQVINTSPGDLRP
jgi:GAF domain-containing protein